MPPFFDFLALGFGFIVFLLLAIVIPGLFIWIGLKVLGKDRGVLRCGFANLAAFVITSFFAFVLHFTPLVVVLPLLGFLIYLYILKTLLDISFIEAFAATVIAGVVIFLIAVILLLILGVWVIFFTPPPMQIGHGKF
uniref:Uncharacterized protein n=1 Tax=Archaeoglobus fulgidus TaxID=2234 RepID=A0A7C3VM79_ARCFL